jgi:chromosomal replication initiation ATPase DnaA
MFGGRHHTTVLHSVKKIEEIRRSDQALDHIIVEWAAVFQSALI